MSDASTTGSQNVRVGFLVEPLNAWVVRDRLRFAYDQTGTEVGGPYLPNPVSYTAYQSVPTEPTNETLYREGRLARAIINVVVDLVNEQVQALATGLLERMAPENLDQQTLDALVGRLMDEMQRRKEGGR